MKSDEDRREIVLAYIASAKSFVQLGSAGLLVPVVLKSDVFGLFGHGATIHPLALTLICTSWLMFLVAIGAGALYEYAAVKFIEYRSDPDGTFVPRPLEYMVKVRGPGIAYGVMVMAFYVGAVAVVLYSATALLM